MKYSILLLLFFLVACDSSMQDSALEDLYPSEKLLLENKVWPYKVRGVIYVVEGYGKPGDHDFWAVGALEVNGEEDQISIEMGTKTQVDAGIDIDSQNTYVLTLDKSLDGSNYPVIRIEK